MRNDLSIEEISKLLDMIPESLVETILAEIVANCSKTHRGRVSVGIADIAPPTMKSGPLVIRPQLPTETCIALAGKHMETEV